MRAVLCSYLQLISHCFIFNLIEMRVVALISAIPNDIAVETHFAGPRTIEHFMRFDCHILGKIHIVDFILCIFIKLYPS